MSGLSLDVRSEVVRYGLECSSLVTSGLELCLPSLSLRVWSEQEVRGCCLGQVWTDVAPSGMEYPV